jgi:hypothetical protein
VSSIKLDDVTKRVSSIKLDDAVSALNLDKITLDKFKLYDEGNMDIDSFKNEEEDEKQKGFSRDVRRSFQTDILKISTKSNDIP